MTSLKLSDLRAAVGGSAAAIRTRVTLQPAGGPGDKVFPPTYATGDRAATKYALETRRIDGQDVPCVLLDSVASQANRMEDALLEGWRADGLPFPVVSVDFSGVEGLEDLGEITSLDAPHRVSDALLRDSTLDGVPWRATPLGKSFTDASVKQATPLYHVCPTALVFGIWDSTGPRGGLGAKFPRALASEIVGIGAATGVKTASRMDPARIQSNVEVFHDAKDPDDWTADAEQAQKKGGKPVAFSRKGGDGKGKPSAINHGNVAPSIDPVAGGVTLDRAEQVTVLSLPALRRLRFPRTADGAPVPAASLREAQTAVRTALAALGVAAMVYQREEGYDLRSRALLVPDGPFELELVPSDGSEPARFTLDREGAARLLTEAHSAAAAYGFAWTRELARLTPSPKLAGLILESRRIAGEHGTAEE